MTCPGSHSQCVLEESGVLLGPTAFRVPAGWVGSAQLSPRLPPGSREVFTEEAQRVVSQGAGTQRDCTGPRGFKPGSLGRGGGPAAGWDPDRLGWCHAAGAPPGFANTPPEVGAAHCPCCARGRGSGLGPRCPARLLGLLWCVVPGAGWAGH